MLSSAATSLTVVPVSWTRSSHSCIVRRLVAVESLASHGTTQLRLPSLRAAKLAGSGSESLHNYSNRIGVLTEDTIDSSQYSRAGFVS